MRRMLESFIVSVEDSIPASARVVKNIGDGLMIVGTDPVALTDWPERPEIVDGFIQCLIERCFAQIRQQETQGGRVETIHVFNADEMVGGPQASSFEGGPAVSTQVAHDLSFEPRRQRSSRWRSLGRVLRLDALLVR